MVNKEVIIPNNNSSSNSPEPLSILNMGQELLMVPRVVKEGQITLGHSIVHTVLAVQVVLEVI